MTQRDKVLRRVLSGRSDANIDFDALCGLLERLGYNHKINGDHHIFRLAGQLEIINIQPRRDGKAKPYQVEQVRDILTRYGQTQIP